MKKTPQLTTEDLSLVLGKLQREAMPYRKTLKRSPMDEDALISLSRIDWSACEIIQQFLDQNN
jgi:hypothetical protein